MSQATVQTKRIHELDLLRGFFILVIILDHAQRLPSIHSYFTGNGKLWVSAAEGFFLISGLLIGYVRGYRQRSLPLKSINKKLIKRGLMLYVWAVGLTFLLTSLNVLLPVNPDYVARPPDAFQAASLPVYIWNVITMQFVYDWVYFLRMYAIILVISPVFLWLLRKGRIWQSLFLSLVIYAGSFLFTPPEGSMQWQLLFFVAAIVGYKLPQIIGWFHTHQTAKRLFMYTSIAASLTIFWVSYFWVLGWPDSGLVTRQQYVDIRAWLDPLFVSLMPLRIVLSLIWFSGILCLFHLIQPWLSRWFGWLLVTFGLNSLSVYCLQAIVLILIQWLLPFSDSRLVNLFINIAIVMLIWGLIKLPLVRKILPR